MASWLMRIVPSSGKSRRRRRAICSGLHAVAHRRSCGGPCRRPFQGTTGPGTAAPPGECPMQDECDRKPEQRLDRDRHQCEPYCVPDSPPPFWIGEEAEPLTVIIGEVVLEPNEVVIREVVKVRVREAEPDRSRQRPTGDKRQHHEHGRKKQPS